MKNGFFKYPSTPHLALLGDIKVRGDKVLSKTGQSAFLQHELVVEEKVDGANIGISFDAEGNIQAQNRGEYLYPPYSGQWKKLTEWLTLRTDTLFDQLTDRYILFGEWCYAQHSVIYDQLPDWFLGFDIYDRNTACFFSCARRDNVFKLIGISQVPKIEYGQFTLLELSELLAQSHICDKPAEGLYLRFDQGDWLVERAKLVRPAFIQSAGEHWSRSGIKANRLTQDIRA